MASLCATLVLGPASSRRTVIERVLDGRKHDLHVCDTLAQAIDCIRDTPVSLVVLTHIDRDVLSFSASLHEKASQPRMVIAVADLRLVELFSLSDWGIDDIIEPDLESEADLSARFCFIERRLARELERFRRAGQHVEEALEESRARTQAILETTVDGIITIDEGGTIETFNAAAERIFAYQAEEVVGRNVHVLMPSPYAEEHDGYMHRYLDTGRRHIIGIGREVEGLRKDGTTFPLELAVSEVFASFGRRIFTGIVRDISERRRLEQEILRIGDQERRRIGQDLHDGLGQMLTGIGLISQSLARKMRGNGQAEATDVEEITSLIKEADQYARGLARSLVPVDVEARGLVSALRRMTRNAERLFRISCSFVEEGDALIHDESCALHLYRIAQEAVSNAVKHGHATAVTVGLSGDREHIRLWIQDDGSGFPDDWQEHQGLGVRTMAYRARIIGAGLDIAVPPDSDRGTRITCSLRTGNHIPGTTSHDAQPRPTRQNGRPQEEDHGDRRPSPHAERSRHDAGPGDGPRNRRAGTQRRRGTGDAGHGRS